MGERELLEGTEVHDVEGKRIGKVMRTEKDLGYFETSGIFSGPRYIPFWAIDHFGPSGVFLNVTRTVVSDVYDRLPEVTPDISPTGRFTGNGHVQSGRTGKMVPLDADGLREVREHIHPGVKVFDADDESVGWIESYDKASGYMRVEQTQLLEGDLFLPATSVSFLDQDGIHLTDTRDTLMSRFKQVPEVARPFFMP
jgi:hypothetical protein